jgi:hypothetical protein
VTLVSVNIIYALAGSFLFFTSYQDLKEKEISGGSYLPKLRVSFADLSTELITAIISTVVLFLWSLMAALLKKPYLALGY